MGRGFLTRRHALRARILRGLEILEQRGAMPPEAELATLVVARLPPCGRGVGQYTENIQLAGADAEHATQLADRFGVDVQQLCRAALLLGYPA